MSLHLSWSRIASVFLSAGDKSALIEIGFWTEFLLERTFVTSIVELQQTRIGRGFSLLGTYLPMRWQSRIVLLCPDPFSRHVKIDLMAWRSFRRRARRGVPCWVSLTPNTIKLYFLLISEDSGEGLGPLALELLSGGCGCTVPDTAAE